jgi:DNA-binding response OmpR family regulator
MRPKKILIVDDSKTAVMTTTMMLAQGRFEVITAPDGEEGVRRALAEHPDLILLDVVMPKLDGFSACRRLRDHETTRQIPIIMTTTRGEAANMEEGFGSGCNDYVTKPINGTELLAKVRSCLGGQGR